MKRSLACMLGACALVFGCVPATEEPDPRGAAGFHTVPSAAARGEPFLTDDGWLVQFERVALATGVSAGSGAYGVQLWNGMAPQDLDAPAVPVGSTSVAITPRSVSAEISSSSDPVAVLGLDPATTARFGRPADDLSDMDTGAGPTFIFRARGAKDDKVVSVDLALFGFFVGLSPPTADVTVHANALATAPLYVVPERVFALEAARLGYLGYDSEGADLGDARTLTFQEIADSDIAGNDDGVASAEELAFHLLPGKDVDGAPVRSMSVLEGLSINSYRVLSTSPAP